MFISASLYSNYVLIPAAHEFRPFYRLFKYQIESAAQGYTLSAYDQVPDTVVIDAEYFGAIAAKTRSFNTRQATLTNLKRCINIGDNEILDVSQGLRMPLEATINTGPLGMVINHIPQLFEIYKDQVLVNFTGNFDFKSKLFKGQCDFLPLDQIWKD